MMNVHLQIDRRLGSVMDLEGEIPDHHQGTRYYINDCAEGQVSISSVETREIIIYIYIWCNFYYINAEISFYLVINPGGRMVKLHEKRWRLAVVRRLVE